MTANNDVALKKFDVGDVVFSKLEDISSLRWHRILTLRSAVFVVEQSCVYADPDDWDLGADHGYLEYDGRIAGYLRMYVDGSDWHIGRVVVAPEIRHRGLARTMMQAALRRVPAHAPCLVSAQVYLHDFYASLGFCVDGSMYLEDGIPHVKMVFTPNADN